MRQIFAVLCVTLLSVLPLSAQTEAVQNVIDDQIAAFQADDLERAFSHASPMIRGIFGNKDRFGQMVRQGYPMVWRPSNFAFGETEDAGERVFQYVTFTDKNGRSFLAQYEMIETDMGWKINGVLMKPLQGAAV